MFHDAAFKKNNEYRQSKSAYVDSLRELEVFIRERETNVPKNDGDSARKRFREWTDATGKHKVMARLISVTDDVVALEKQDGKKINVPLAKLSQKDRAYAQSHKR